MKRTKPLSLLIAIGWLLGLSSAHASSVFFLPSQLEVVIGDAFELEIWLDFSNDPVIGGGFDVAYDEDALDFVSWTAAGLGDPAFAREPDILPGLLSGIGVGDFSVGISGPAVVGHVVFSLVAIPDAFPFILLQDTQSVAGPFISLTTFSVVNPVYGSVELIVPVAIPLPAGFVLLASAVAGVAGLRRVKTACPAA